MTVALLERARFALSLYDFAHEDVRALDAPIDAFTAASGDAIVVLASSTSAVATVRDAPSFEGEPEVLTPWIRARTWATSHRQAPIARPATRTQIEVCAGARALVDVDRNALDRVALGALARPFVFGRVKKAKQRLDRVQDAWVSANGPSPRRIDIVTVAPARARVKDLLREGRAEHGAKADDGKRVAAALVEAWLRSDVELLRSP